MLPVLVSILLRWDSSVLAQSTTFSGGLALRIPGACPSDLVSGEVTFESNCCAANQTFVKDEDDSVCCPDDNDCYSEVEKAARCADSSWQLCDSGLGFCCLENWICFTQFPISGNGGGVGCSTPGATLNSIQSEVPTVAGEATVDVSVTSLSSTSEAMTPSTASVSSAFVSPTAAASRITVTAQTATSSLSSPSPTQSTSSSGLNNAGRIGIGVGVSLGVLVSTIIAFLAYMLRRRTRSLREKDNIQVPASYDMKGDPTHVSDQNRLVRGTHELHGIPHSGELQGSGIQHPEELQGSVAPYRRELP